MPPGIVTVTADDVPWSPAASRAIAVSVYVPGARPAGSNVVEYGVVVSSAPRLSPLTLNCTPTTPTLSVALAVTVIGAVTVVPFVGAVIVTVGADVTGTVTTTAAD